MPLAPGFRETLTLHMQHRTQMGGAYLLESAWKRRHSDRGVRRMFERSSVWAGLEHAISPHQLRHILLTWLKRQGLDAALLQPSSGHAARQSLEVYSHLALEEAQRASDGVIARFPLQSVTPFILRLGAASLAHPLALLAEVQGEAPHDLLDRWR